MNQTEKTMLALAALTYRGIGCHSEAAIYDRLAPWLGKLEKEELGRWEIAWGPASFRVPISLVDDAMVFVAKRTDPPVNDQARWVVAIRGTNPASLFDWVFGDLWVNHLVPWAASPAPDVLVSASTSLGHEIIRNLAAESIPSSTSHLIKVSEQLASRLDSVAAGLPELDVRTLLGGAQSFGDENLFDRIIRLIPSMGEKLRQRAFDVLGDGFGSFRESIRGLQEAASREIFQRLREEIVQARAADSGRTLVEFLTESGPHGERVAVTGHSKGGALCLVTALGLEEEWAPDAGTEIECYAFAGPTCGNARFAEYYEARLGKRTRRVVNRRDIVPHAWHTADLRRIAGVYPELGVFIRILAESVEEHGYAHLPGSVTEFEGKRRHSTVMPEIIHQHLDAYLEEAGFREDWSARELMLG